MAGINDYLSVLSPLIGLSIQAVMQLLTYRFYRKTGLLKSIFFGFFFGFLVVAVIEVHIIFRAQTPFPGMLGGFFLNMITYGALGYGYFHFINLGETARRIRIIRELWGSDIGLTMDELIEKYNASQIISLRVERMVRNKQIILKNNRYHIRKPLLLLMARVIVFLKILLLKRKGELIPERNQNWSEV